MAVGLAASSVAGCEAAAHWAKAAEREERVVPEAKEVGRVAASTEAALMVGEVPEA